MKKLAAALCALSLLAPVGAIAKDPDVPPHSLHAMGCMKLGECTEGVFRIKSIEDVKKLFPLDAATFSQVEAEGDKIIKHLTEIGVEVYLADSKYFPTTHRGAYYTDVNKFYLNSGHMQNANVFIHVLRHEGWHAAQDCMAGTIDNTIMAVIKNDDEVPDRHKMDADIRYFASPNVVPWEQEAIWAGHQPGMTEHALKACGSETPMWEIYPPTPKTRSWLINQGYINE